MHFIYLITNLINNKVYIGQTNNPILRWSQHKSNAKYNRGHQVITKAMVKHGVSNFTFEVIASCKDQKNADSCEAEIINQYDSRNIYKGYNIDAGGNTTPRTPDILKKISESLKKHYQEHQSHMKGKKLSEEWKLNMSKASIGKPGTNTGKNFDDTWRLKISKSLAGKSRQNRRRFNQNIEKQICKLYTDENYSMYALGKKFNCQRSLISTILKRNNIKQRDSNYRGHQNIKKKFSEIQEKEICELYLNNNLNIKDLSVKFNCGKTTIRDILLRNNVKL